MADKKRIEVICDVCGQKYLAFEKDWKYAEKKGRKHCCSQSCQIQLRKNGKIVKCCCCGKEFYRSKKDLREDEIYYCSQECAHKCINHGHQHTDEEKKKISDSLKQFCQTDEFQEVKKNKKLKSSKIKKVCPICHEEFQVFPYNKKRIFCSRKCYLKDKDFQFKKKVPGGIRKGSSRAYKGWYKGYYCDSSWELAYVIYNIEHGVFFERNLQGFEYEYNGEKHLFYPDFKLEDGSYVEVKGYMGEQNEIKIKSFRNKIEILGRKEIRPYLDYAKSKYGKDFIKLYE